MARNLPLINNSSWRFRLPADLLAAFVEASGGPGKASDRLRSLMTQYVGKRQRERDKRPVKAEATGAEPDTLGRSNPSGLATKVM